MLLLAAVAIAVTPSPNAAPAQTTAIVQARATVRIISGVRLQWDQSQRSSDVPAARTTVVQTVNGPQPAKLIEFE